MSGKNNIININEVMKMIPHRYPLLLVDKVLDIKENSIVGVKNVTMNEPQFTGHFPNNPVMPGVLIIEAMAQLSAIFVASTMQATADKDIYFMSVEGAKFRKVVLPGDTMIMHAKAVQNRGSVWKFDAYAEVDGQLAAESRFTAMVKYKN